MVVVMLAINTGDEIVVTGAVTTGEEGDRPCMDGVDLEAVEVVWSVWIAWITVVAHPWVGVWAEAGVVRPVMVEEEEWEGEEEEEDGGEEIEMITDPHAAEALAEVGVADLEVTEVHHVEVTLTVEKMELLLHHDENKHGEETIGGEVAEEDETKGVEEVVEAGAAPEVTEVGSEAATGRVVAAALEEATGSAEAIGEALETVIGPADEREDEEEVEEQEQAIRARAAGVNNSSKVAGGDRTNKRKVREDGATRAAGVVIKLRVTSGINGINKIGTNGISGTNNNGLVTATNNNNKAAKVEPAQVSRVKPQSQAPGQLQRLARDLTTKRP
uniref:Uncharacterized protein n=1 Tax=Cacopsylla melanoneura TaxID=428564 RepID=A0A8D8UD34_9HEMI